MVRIAKNEIHFGWDIPLQTIIEKIEAVSENEIMELANDLVDRSQIALTLLGPVDTTKKELEEIIFR
jgi:predicted Zn-dependent peptidase